MIAAFLELLYAEAPRLLALAVGEALLCLSAFGAADKHRLWDRYDLNRRAWWPAQICRLCVAFWLAQLAGAPLAVLHPVVLLCPFLSAGLTLMLYRQSL